MEYTPVQAALAAEGPEAERGAGRAQGREVPLLQGEALQPGPELLHKMP
ncbi:MAG: hypothetical protein FWB99_12550 [Treponema sp.]|nr:hypothetical protein [Treponema sp.]MCL2233892.1 hypothetical protein [Treponema sp.]